MQTETEKKKGGVPKRRIHRAVFWQDVLTLLAAALFGRISIMGGVSPFAIAFLAGAGMAGLSVHAAVAGALAGTLVLQGAPQLPHAAACAFYYALLLVWRRFKKDFGKFDQLLLLFLAQATLMPFFYRSAMEELLRAVISLAISVLSALILQNALRTLRSLRQRHVLTDGEQLSVSVAFGVLLLSVTDVSGLGFSLPVVLLLLFSLTATLARGIAGVAVAVALSAMLLIGGDFPLSFVGGIAVCSLAGAALRSLDSIGVLGGFAGCSLLVGTYVFTASHTINLLNLAAAGSAFLLIPKERMLRLCAFLDADKERERYARKSIRRMRECTSSQMRRVTSAIREMAQLYQTEPHAAEPPDALLQWTSQAAYGVCADCSLKKLCWRDRKWASETVQALLNAHERGERIRIRKPFDPSCRHMQHIASAAWQAQNQYRVQLAMQKQTARQYAFINRQLSGVCEIIDDLSERVVRGRWLDEELEKTVLRGLDRRGFRVFGVDALYPEGKLQLRIRVPSAQLYDIEPFTDAVQQALRRPVRVLSADLDGKQCTLLLEEAQHLTASMGTAGVPVSPNGISGDSAGERRMEHGRVLYALSDGMGAGEEARSESDSALRFLFDLYEAGFSRDVALESVNRLLLERSEDMYATLDAVFVDLRSGDAEFMKYGAPPSFVYRGNKLHTVCSEALPAGILGEAVPAVSSTKLRRNDAVILLSDGALEALGDTTHAAIEDALLHTMDSQDAAQTLLGHAAEREHADDMTVMVIRIA